MTDDAFARAAKRAASLALIAAILILPAAIERLVQQTAEMRFPDDPWLGVAWQMLSATNWGTAWLIQVGAAIALAIVLVFARRGITTAWAATSILFLALLVTPTLASHAMSAEGRRWIAVPADVVHLAGATLWLGTLAIMFGTARIATPTDDGNSTFVAALLPVFSPLALTGATLVLLTGVVSSLIHLEHPLAALESRYGQVLIAKILAVLAILFLGWLNWKKLTPDVRASGSARIWRGMRAELIATVIVLLLTAALIVTPPPMEAMTMGLRTLR
ncbi:MAG TPA: CopD family protein [Gemmatimonadaceae bacterium]